ncbi:transposase [Cupriavidus sp. 8B]
MNELGAWLGLTPLQQAQDGETGLGRTSLRGHVYLRPLLVQGARSTLQSALRTELRIPVREPGRAVGYSHAFGLPSLVSVALQPEAPVRPPPS